LNHLIKKKKKAEDEPPSPKFANRKEERIYNLAIQEIKQLQQQQSSSFQHEIIPVKYLEVKRKNRLGYLMGESNNLL
jgi:hypothetical protein